MSETSKRLLFQITFVAVAVLLIEGSLRIAGYKPGDMKPKWLNFAPVDTLKLVSFFKINSDGLLVGDSLAHARNGTHINEGGFRSPNLATLDTTKNKIMLIGDSFTWGMSAKPVENNCFADLLRNETNYEVINMGVPAADPVQYAIIAKKYIPQVKPNYVLLIFFMGNDLMHEDRPHVPGEPFCYFTNAGTILADIDGRHFKTAEAAYNYIVNEKYYLRHPKNIVERIVAHSSILSRIYSVNFRLKEKLEYERLIKNTAVTKKYLAQVKRVCIDNNVPFKIVLIPEIKEANMPLQEYGKKYNNLLRDYSLERDWLMFENIKANFLDYPDAHLNNQGHRFYADSIKAFLKNAPELK